MSAHLVASHHLGEIDEPESFSLGPWTLDPRTNQLRQGELCVDLEHRLTSLLLFFLQHRNQILTKDKILKAIWQGKVVNDDSLAVAVSQLRKALHDNPRAPTYIKTIPGVGYQFILQPGTAPVAVTLAKDSASNDAGLNSQITTKNAYLLIGFLSVALTFALIGLVFQGNH